MQRIPGRAYRAKEGRHAADRTFLDRGIRYLAAAMFIAAAGAVYEIFSHGVYSYYMIYAFAVPLAAGALPNLLAERSAGRRRNSDTGAGGHLLSSGLQLAAIATLTTGCLMKGVLDIYGTTNRLMTVYVILGLMLLVAAAAAYIAEMRKKPDRPASASQYQ